MFEFDEPRLTGTASAPGQAFAGGADSGRGAGDVGADTGWDRPDVAAVVRQRGVISPLD